MKHFAFIISGFIILTTAFYVQSCKQNLTTRTDYQIVIDTTGQAAGLLPHYLIYDDGVSVGRLQYGTNPTLDSLIDKDNL